MDSLTLVEAIILKNNYDLTTTRASLRLLKNDDLYKCDTCI